LIRTDAPARELGGDNLRVFDFTTYLEPPPPGSDDPYIAVPGRSSYETAHIPGADFPGLGRRL
jgi:thiosulfate/3-mercaptopyruvate sulfurtransferase